MITVLQTLADKVEMDEATNMMSIIRMVDQINAPGFPVRVDVLGLAVKVELQSEDYGQQAEVQIDVVNESGGGASLPGVFRQTLPSPTEPGRPCFWSYGVNFEDLTFQEPGRFEFVVRINSKIIAEVPLWVVPTR